MSKRIVMWLVLFAQASATGSSVAFAQENTPVKECWQYEQTSRWYLSEEMGNRIEDYKYSRGPFPSRAACAESQRKARSGTEVLNFWWIDKKVHTVKGCEPCPSRRGSGMRSPASRMTLDFGRMSSAALPKPPRKLIIEESDSMETYRKNMKHVLAAVTVQDMLAIEFCRDSGDGLFGLSEVERQSVDKTLNRVKREVIKKVLPGLAGAFLRSPAFAAGTTLLIPDAITADPVEILDNPKDYSREELRNAARMILLGYNPSVFRALPKKRKAMVLNCWR